MADTTIERPIDRVLVTLGFPEEKRGGYYITHCKSHPDRDPSLYIRLDEDDNVIVKCLAGCSTEEVCASLGITVAALFSDYKPRPPLPGISVIDLAIDKKLHPNLLLTYGVTDARDKGKRCVRIAYQWPDGSEFSRTRMRNNLTAKEGSYWSEGDEQTILYGSHKLEDARKAGYLIWCEGESDVWTCWAHGLPAIGVPGVGNTGAIERTITTDMLNGIDRHYVMQEPGKGGKTLPINVRKELHSLGATGNVYILNLHRDADGAKDPNDLHKRGPKAFKDAMQDAMEAADNRVRAHPKPTISRLCDLQAEILPEPRWAIDPILPEV